MGGKLLVIISSGLIAVLLSTLLLPSEKPWKENTFKLAKIVLPSNYRSPILHIILDGHLGLAAFPRQIEGVERLKKELEVSINNMALRFIPMLLAATIILKTLFQKS